MDEMREQLIEIVREARLRGQYSPRQELLYGDMALMELRVDMVPPRYQGAEMARQLVLLTKAKGWTIDQAVDALEQALAILEEK